MNKKVFLLLFLNCFMFSCNETKGTNYCQEFCVYPDRYHASYKYVLGALKKQDGYTLSRFKVDSVDNNIYFNETDGKNGVKLFIVRCTYLEDYYDNDTNILKNINFAYYLNSDCEGIFNFNDVKNYFSSLSSFVAYYEYSSIENCTLYSGSKDINIENCCNYNLIEFPTFIPIINDKIDYTGFETIFNTTPSESYFKGYIKFDMTMDELKEGFTKIKEDSLTYDGKYDLPIK